MCIRDSYALAALGVYVACERTIFYSVALRQARRLSYLKPAELTALDAANAGPGVVGEVLSDLRNARPNLRMRHEHEDSAELAYIAARSRLQRHLWIMDTLVTAAPLLGLLGTILGIIDTFQALATSGISDPAAVSRGIGTALFATALGIGIALAGLLANNFFLDKVERIGDLVKIVILKAGLGHGEVVALHPPERSRVGSVAA